jgi:AAA family ATP:ADP antiporter
VLRSLLGWAVEFRDEKEPRGMLQAAAYGFSIMFGYYILRAVRDEISAADRGNLQILWTVVFFVMIFAVQAYSWVASRYSRGVFVPLANRFFIACLIGFWASLVFMPEAARPWIDRVFYVWTSVFALFVVTVFWGLVADCFTNDQGKRLFGFIAIGSSLGGIAGSAVTAYLAVRVPVFALLLISCAPLELASWFAASLHRNFGTGSVKAPSAEADKPLAGDAWSGMKAVFASPYLLGIASFIALMTFASTILYFAQSNLVYEAMTDRGERTAFLARIDLVVNVLTICLEVYLTARIIKWFGVAVTLTIVPVAVAGGFVAMGLWPTLWTLVIVQVLYRAGRYGLAKPAREVLFTVVSREEKYKSKAFIDAAVYRGGDLVSGWIYAGLAAFGLAIGSIALVAAPAAVLWAVVAFGIGKKGEERAARLDDADVDPGLVG